MALHILNIDPFEGQFSSNRPTGPIRSSSRYVRMSVCVVSVPFPCDFFRGLSLALRSHDQIPASHWSTPSPPPTSRSRISKIFRDSEYLGKSNGKKWSQIWTFLFENCRKLRHKKMFFSSLFSIFFCFRSFLTVFLPPLPEVGCPIFLEIRNPWGKVLERSGLTFEHFCLEVV